MTGSEADNQVSFPVCLVIVDFYRGGDHLQVQVMMGDG